ncbi:MAG: hypothetical protein ISF22_02750 [Methanomassiliicoccus sp.]|nr:hypothetical protein [Methanomassiliicoccus sp.]
MIETVGKNVTRFSPGDNVLGISGMRMSTYAEYVCISEDSPMVLKPDDMPFEEAAVISTGGLEALHFHQKSDHQARIRQFRISYCKCSSVIELYICQGLQTLQANIHLQHCPLIQCSTNLTVLMVNG